MSRAAFICRPAGADGADGAAFADLRQQVGQDLLAHRQYATAETYLRECLTILRARQPDAWGRFAMESLLGGALLGQKKYAEAEPLLVSGYSGMKQREKAILPAGRTKSNRYSHSYRVRPHDRGRSPRGHHTRRAIGFNPIRVSSSAQTSTALVGRAALNRRTRRRKFISTVGEWAGRPRSGVAVAALAG